MAMCAVRLIGRYKGREFLDRNTKFTLGEGSEVNIVDGVEQGLRSMKAGERALLRIKSRYAYGTEGSEKLGVPPDADVEFDVDFELYDPVCFLLILHYIHLYFAKRQKRKQ